MTLTPKGRRLLARRSRLAMDWADGAKFKDFLGFAIMRSTGFHLREKDG
jgi:hypothetical protein